jgi:hypothetical protein
MIFRNDNQKKKNSFWVKSRKNYHTTNPYNTNNSTLQTIKQTHTHREREREGERERPEAVGFLETEGLRSRVKWGITDEMVGGNERIKVPFGINPNFIVDHGHHHHPISNIINQLESLVHSKTKTKTFYPFCLYYYYYYYYYQNKHYFILYAFTMLLSIFSLI